MRHALAALIAPALLLPILVASPAVAATGGLTASDALAQLVTAAPISAGYDRSLFQHWIDADGDGCDTRQEVLIAESTTPVVKGAGCTVVSGTWYSWYDGETWTNPSDVDIDHLVPLSEAWQSGAYQWSASQRRAFANDLESSVALEAVTDNVNQSKGDRDPAVWMPPLPEVACQYATNWVLVKSRWNLTVDTAERAALSGILSGGCGSADVTLPSAAGVTAPQPAIQRLSGNSRYETAVAISQQFTAGVDVVYIATGEDYPDALSAAPAAAIQGGPLLLTPPSALPKAVRSEIARLNPKLIVVVGGVGVVSNSVYKALKPLAPQIRRDSGNDRYETSRVVIERAFPDGASLAYFSTGANFPDALSAGAAAGRTGSPVFLVDGSAKKIDSATAKLIKRLGVTTASIAGGTGVVSSSIATSLRSQPTVGTVLRAAGQDRYTTSREVNRAAFTSASQAFFAVGTGFADALAGAALAGQRGMPLYVVPGNCVPKTVVSDLKALGTTSRVLLGGSAVLGSGVKNLKACGATKPPPSTPTVKNPGDTKNCTDFSTWGAAQAWFNKYFPKYGDVARLDADGDRIACESLPGAP